MICGGQETERQYVEFLKSSLRLRSVTVKQRTSGSAPDRLAQDAAQETGTFDHVWVLCDVDNFHSQITKAIDAAESTGVHLAISNPCFEVWIVWHAESNNGRMSIRQFQKRADSLNLVTGKKKKDLRLDALKGKFVNAEQRARAVRAEHSRAQRKAPDNLPSSDVDLLVRAVLEAEGVRAEIL